MVDGSAASNFAPGAQTVHRALSVLVAFSEERPLMSVAEIAAVTSLTVPTAHRIVNALVAEGFLLREPVGRLYGIGPAVARLGELAAYAQTSFAFLEPLLRAVYEETQETVGLHVRSGHLRVCISEFQSPHRVRVTSGVGNTYPMLRGAASKALMAWMRLDQLDSLLAGVATKDAADAIRDELERVRRRGYATSFGETIPGAHAVSAPVLNMAGLAVASVNVTAPADRLPRDRMRRIGRDLVSRLEERPRQERAADEAAGAPE